MKSQKTQFGCHGHVLMPVPSGRASNTGMSTCPWHPRRLITLLLLSAACGLAPFAHAPRGPKGAALAPRPPARSPPSVLPAKRGAPAPKNTLAVSSASLRKEHWAWQPVKKDAPPPAVKDTAWPRTDVDRFLLAS